LEAPGSARFLLNFEPSIQGGYRRINGFNKYDDNVVPYYGDAKVQGSGQTGSTLEVANLHQEPQDGDTLTISGASYTIASGGVSYSSANRSATLTLTTSLSSSPSDQESVVFTSGSSRIEGVYYATHGKAYAVRGGTLWASAGSGWTSRNTPDYGTVLVNGASQTGTSLVVDGISSDDYVPQPGDTFTISGVEKVYTVLSEPSVSSGGGTLSIHPSLDSSPADNASVTFLNTSLTGATKCFFKEFNFDGTVKTVMVDGSNKPCVFTSNSFKTLQGSSDVVGASVVEEFVDHLFFGKDDLITFTAPFNEEDFTPANGAGNYRLDGDCTGLIVFRQQLVSFTLNTIKQLSGTSVSTFQLNSITEQIGCLSKDTVQQVGGDVLYLSSDGVRFLGATARIGDFALSLASRQIQKEFQDWVVPTGNYSAVLVRPKSQYRIFKYSGNNPEVAEGYIGTQFMDQSGSSINWSKTKGIQAYRTYSNYVNGEEFILFSNSKDYVYLMESGSTFDGEEIRSEFFTPYMAVNDPAVRKTGYALRTYLDPEGPYSGTVTLEYDFGSPGKIQPASNSLQGGGSFSLWGDFVWNQSTWGGTPETVSRNQVIGSFFNVSIKYSFEGGPPFVIDTAILEYSTEDRK
jgi:hypothetical protein